MIAQCPFIFLLSSSGFRVDAAVTEFSSILPEEVEEELKSAAEISMGTEISQEDCDNIVHLCDQVIEISEYRAQLYDYLKNRMLAIAPNLTLMVGELVGARLIAHAGKSECMLHSERNLTSLCSIKY
jgi:nucleolar protein 58